MKSAGQQRIQAKSRTKTQERTTEWYHCCYMTGQTLESLSSGDELADAKRVVPGIVEQVCLGVEAKISEEVVSQVKYTTFTVLLSWISEVDERFIN